MKGRSGNEVSFREMRVLVCSEVTELTTDYLERTLPMARRLAMKLHLSICKLCQRHLLHVAQTVELLRRLPPAETPPVTEDNLIALLVAAGPERDMPPRR